MRPPKEFPEYLTTKEVAGLLKFSRKTIREWILTGKLPAKRFGGQHRIRRDDLDHFMRGD